MSRFRYRVACLTHGGEEPLAETLESFEEWVTPAPLDWIIAQDGPGYWTIPEHFSGYAGQPWAGQVGFCEATRRLWQMASKSREINYGERGQAFFIPDPPEFIFWLEHDFIFTRALDLGPLAQALTADPTLAQMALMRTPVNEQELRAGGLYESRPGEYTQEDSFLRQRSYFTTNPSLMTTAFMRENPWPVYPEECEGRFGLDLVEHGYSFGVWGSGEPWCEHIGTRTGHGY